MIQLRLHRSRSRPHLDTLSHTYIHYPTGIIRASGSVSAFASLPMSFFVMCVLSLLVAMAALFMASFALLVLESRRT